MEKETIGSIVEALLFASGEAIELSESIITLFEFKIQTLWIKS